MKAIVKGKEIKVNWLSLLARKDQVMLQIADGRSLSEIAADWEGADVIERISETEGNKTYKGYTRMMRIVRVDNIGRGIVEIVLGKN